MKQSLKNIFLIVFIVTIILGSPILLNRINTEKNNNVYEIGISAQSILNLNKEQMNRLYNKMNKVNVSTLIFDNLNLYEIEKYRQIEIDTVNEFLEKDNSQFSENIPNDYQKENIVIKLTKKDFNWCDRFRYDFYIPSINAIIETNGEQHYKETTNFKSKLEDIVNNDKAKKRISIKK